MSALQYAMKTLKGLSYTCSILVVLAACAPNVAKAQSWTLVWSDEFNGPAFSAPDALKWNYDTGGGGWGNNEEEVYCAFGSNTAPCSASTPNAYLDGTGNLIIQALNNSGTWTSARMQTHGKEDLQYGRIEARMKLPQGAGIWPAFWTLGSNFNYAAWPLCGEMDIMENVPQDTSGKITSTMHGPFSGGNGTGAAATLPSGGSVSDFHVYGVTWSPNQAQFYVDDPSTPFFTITKNSAIQGDWVYNHQFFIIMNLAIGGYYPGYSSGTTPNPAVMTVDYVRVYRPSNALASGPISINAGGDSEGNFFADTNFSGASTTASTAASIDTSHIPAPVPSQAVYQAARVGPVKYTITGLTPGNSYNVQLHFAEIQASGAAQRTFNVNINNRLVLSNFDIFATAGAMNRAIEENFLATADPLGGSIVVNLIAGTSGQPLVSGIVVTPAGQQQPMADVSIDAGGGAVGNFLADADFTGGTISTSSAPVDTSLIAASVPPQAVLQSERYGAFSYTVPGFIPGSSHTVTLYFNEIYWSSPGQREFNVLINGTQVLTNFDIVGQTGAKNRAIAEQFPATANSQGAIAIQFDKGALDLPKISGFTIR